MRNPKKLRVLQQARDWVKAVYAVTNGLPDVERFGLQSQTRRAAVSVVANLAEGHGRGTEGAFEQHLRIALGSMAETECLLDLAIDLGLLDVTSVAPIQKGAASIGRQLVALTQTVHAGRGSSNS